MTEELQRVCYFNGCNLTEDGVCIWKGQEMKSAGTCIKYEGDLLEALNSGDFEKCDIFLKKENDIHNISDVHLSLRSVLEDGTVELDIDMKF